MSGEGNAPSQRGPSPGATSGGNKTPQRRNSNRKSRQNSNSGGNKPAIDPAKANSAAANRGGGGGNSSGGGSHNRSHSRRGSSNAGSKNANQGQASEPSSGAGEGPRRPQAHSPVGTNISPSVTPPNPSHSPSMSTLNPNAGGFQPGGLSALTEVQNEVLVTPTADVFDFNNMSAVLNQTSPAFASPANAAGAGGGLAAGGQPTIAQQMAQLQQLQLMQQQLGSVSPQSQQQQLVNMQANLLNQIRLQQTNQQGALPPRFSASQSASAAPLAASVGNPAVFNNNPLMSQQGQDVNSLYNESMAIKEQIEMLTAQQNELYSRFAGMQQQQQSSPVDDLQSQQQQQQQNFGGIPRAGHRRHQSQQPAGMSSMGQFATGMPAPTGFGGQGLGQQQTQLPKGHGRRHSVNVVSKQPGGQQQQQPPLSTSPVMNTANSPTNMMQRGGLGGGNFQFPFGGAQGHQPSQSMDFGAELDFGASPSSGQTGTSTGPASVAPVAANASASGWTPGHRSRESRSSISSMSGWGTNSGQYVQNAIPSATTTDLAQALSQLQQLSSFRASAGHAKVPSFGMSNNQNFFGGNNQGGNQQRKSLFGPYLPAQSIPPLVAANQVVVGTLRVNKRNRSDAYVTSDALDSDIYICGSKDRNRALEGDVVAVQLLDVDDVWGAKKEKEEKKRKKEESAAYDARANQNIRKQDKKNDDVEVEGQGLTLFDEEEVNDEQRPQYAGHVVGVVHRAPGQVFAGTLGVLRPSSAATKEKQEAERREREGVDLRGKPDQAPVRIVWLRPTDKRVPLLAIPVNEAPEDFVDNPDKYANRLFCASIKRWPITSLHPFGSLGEELGPIGDLETETNALMKDCNFSIEDFNEPILKCLPPLPFSIPAREIEVRQDLRETRIFTIDPVTAKDLDDALHITRKDNGTFEVGVHIADVSHFVKPNTALDREARKRATTVYLVQRAYPMLPPALSEDVCSLAPGEDKLAFSVIFTMSSEARVLSTWFGKTIIRSCAKLSYADAEVALKEDGLPTSVDVQNNQKADDIKQDLIDLMGLARQMRQRRFEDHGALRIDNIRLGFSLDEQGQPLDCHVQEPMESKHLIEEFMLLSNISVAQRIAAGLPEQALLRRHEDPIERRLQGFAKRAKTLGVDIDVSSAGALMQSLNEVTDTQARLTLKVLSTKAMKRARYFCSGMLDISQYHHYALNVPLYTHFTSPIRRYADVIVHRELEAILLGAADTKFSMNAEAVSEVAQICNSKKDAAAQAQESSQHLFLCTMINNLTLQYGPVVRTAQIIGVLDEAFDVVVPDFGIEKRVHIEQMPVENHVYDEQSNTLALYWKKGVDVVKWLADHSGDAHLQYVKQTAERHASMMEASTTHASDEQKLFDDDDAPQQAIPDSDQHRKSANKEYPHFEGTEITSQGHHIQTIQELQKVPVIVTADVSKSPPVLKVISLNPFP